MRTAARLREQPEGIPQRERAALAARAFALEFLRPLVQRGDTLDTICSFSRVHACATRSTLQIGGEVFFEGRRHRIAPRQLVVKEMDGQVCLYIFEVEDLYVALGGTLPQRCMQLPLWESVLGGPPQRTFCE